MNRDHLAGRLKQFNGKIKEHWCKLHNDQIGVIAAKRYQIAGSLQAQCGLAQQESARRYRLYNGASSGRRSY
ncbi:MAG: general stress protein CsbD [Burkholderiaceae bacterium]